MSPMNYVISIIITIIIIFISIYFVFRKDATKPIYSINLVMPSGMEKK